MERSSSSWRALRASAAFFTAAGVVLAILVAGVILREIVAPPAQTWSAWTRGAIFAISGLAILFCVIGGLLSYRLHRACHESVRAFFSQSDRDQVTTAIRAAEGKTSGEIVVHLAHRAHHMPTVDARKAFEKIGMARTKERNGVLFFVSVGDCKLAVIGDRGIHDRVKPEFWNEVIRHVETRFSESRFGEGLADGIAMVGSELARHFPRRADDVNELPDAPSEDRDDRSR
jgi:uncharacterized membrane protein